MFSIWPFMPWKKRVITSSWHFHTWTKSKVLLWYETHTKLKTKDLQPTKFLCWIIPKNFLYIFAKAYYLSITLEMYCLPKKGTNHSYILILFNVLCNITRKNAYTNNNLRNTVRNNVRTPRCEIRLLVQMLLVGDGDDASFFDGRVQLTQLRHRLWHAIDAKWFDLGTS